MEELHDLEVYITKHCNRFWFFILDDDNILKVSTIYDEGVCERTFPYFGIECLRDDILLLLRQHSTEHVFYIDDLSRSERELFNELEIWISRFIDEKE